MTDYDDPVVEDNWCSERRAQVTEYLQREGVTHGRIGEWPAWHVAPYVSIWAIQSAAHPERLGWWAICGDLPTDYISAKDVINPRNALHSIAVRWSELASFMLRGQPHPDVKLGTPETWSTLGPLLQSRAKLLTKWAEDDSMWEADAL